MGHRLGLATRTQISVCNTSVDSGDLNQAPPKQSAVCSTCIIPAPPVNCHFIWMASAFGMSATHLSWGDSRPYAVLQRTLDEDCRQAEEPKQLADEASRFCRFCTEQGHCGACRTKWRLTDTDLCPYGETQTMSPIVESCPLTKLNGGLPVSRLHSADEDAVSWLTNYGS